MLKKLLLGCIIILQLVIVSGCWDYRDINKVNFPTTGAYDLHDENQTAVTLQQEKPLVDLTVIIPNISPDANSQFRVETTSGLTIGNARGQKSYSSTGAYSAGFAAVIIFGEGLATSPGINNIIEGLFRGAQIPKTENFAVAEGRAESILRIPVKDYPSMAEYLKGLLYNSQDRAFIPATTLHNFGVEITSPGKNPIMPLLIINEEKVEVTGAAIFKKDRMIGKANLQETRILMMLRGLNATGNIPFVIKRDGVMLDKGSVDLKNSRKVKVDRNGDDFNFEITIMLKGNLVEHQFGKFFTENEDLRTMIEDQIAADITEDCQKFIRKMQQEYKVDCIDISKYALAKWRKELKEKVDNQDFIENVNVKVEVKMHLQNVGELS